jgi:hypothetical protein
MTSTSPDTRIDGAPFMRKPFTPAQLLAGISVVLK